MAGILVPLAIGLACAACSAAPPTGLYSGPPLSPLYNVTPDMLRPNGTMRSGLLPENPNDQM